VVNIATRSGAAWSVRVRRRSDQPTGRGTESAMPHVSAFGSTALRKTALRKRPRGKPPRGICLEGPEGALSGTWRKVAARTLATPAGLAHGRLHDRDSSLGRRRGARLRRPLRGPDRLGLLQRAATAGADRGPERRPAPLRP